MNRHRCGCKPHLPGSENVYLFLTSTIFFEFTISRFHTSTDRWFVQKITMEKHLSNLREVLGPDGLIAKQLTGYEFRPQQLEMAEAVASALSGSEHLVVEAGTGVGKSFAYLLPAINLALDTHEPVVISTILSTSKNS